MTDWDRRFRTGEYPQDPDPSGILVQFIDAVPDGRAIDIATGTGRNAVFLADCGYTVDAIDQSQDGLRITANRAAARDVDDRLNAIQADISTYEFPRETYEFATISFYRAVDRFPDIKDALVPGGYLFVEHHLRSTEATPSGPSTDRYRFAANELLHANLDLTVLHYDEAIEARNTDKRRATARLVARKTSGGRQSYPVRSE
ncbi:class I SAM-dependent methyltransferase [Halalkalirubrum salinum]|uniref:class I SAM-dependent methyltransferase n=1 Tax=Halalkalirubrum salinum TaxID=2563889 RepID=UPI0010FB839F|nr:class I SAM-dependent methyltransferase [Halalkalirubrum salinum]